MSEPERLRETERWLRFAPEDLSAAERTVERREVPRHACFLSQQAAEKAVKAALVFLQVEFPYLEGVARDDSRGPVEVSQDNYGAFHDARERVLISKIKEPVS